MSITGQLLSDRFERTSAAATAIIDAERAAREAKTARLRALRLAKERETEEKRKDPAKRSRQRATGASASDKGGRRLRRP